jgi:hypothetical protein
LLLAPALAGAQTRPDSVVVPAMPEVMLDSVQVGPQAVDTKGWLLLDKDIEIELDGAVHNLYNFKFDKADKQFRSLRRRYPNHPMAYFLLGLSNWWKMMPLPVEDKRYDRAFLAYLDTAETKALAMYKADNRNYEACFFLSGAHAFEARFHAERKNWSKATVESRNTLNYLQKSREANGLSVEFEFGFGMFDYYAVWIHEEYPWLRPILLFFPKGNRQKGIEQLKRVGQTAVYTKTEANFYLTMILASAREKQTGAALRLSQQLVAEYPDNSRFQVDNAKLCFSQGLIAQCEATCREILRKNSVGMFGYEATAGRTAAYLLGRLAELRPDEAAKAKDYYLRCIVFAETANLTSGGYYLHANAGLARLANREKDIKAARRYYNVVMDKADKQSPEYAEARNYLRLHRKDS